MTRKLFTRSDGRVLRHRSWVELMEDYALFTEKALREVTSLSTQQVDTILRYRSMRNRLVSCTAKELPAIRKQLVEELMKPEEEGGMNLRISRAYQVVAGLLGSIARARKLEKATHRMILEQRNEEAWEIAHAEKDVSGMNAADKNYIALHQLDQPDEVKIDPDTVAVPNVLATTRYSDVLPGSDVDEDPWEAIKKAKKVAEKGIIDLKEGRDYVITDVDEFGILSSTRFGDT